jgi:hypothetical protein
VIVDVLEGGLEPRIVNTGNSASVIKNASEMAE